MGGSWEALPLPPDFWLRGNRGPETHTSEAEGGGCGSWRTSPPGSKGEGGWGWSSEEGGGSDKAPESERRGWGPELLGLKELGAGAPRMTELTRISRTQFSSSQLTGATFKFSARALSSFPPLPKKSWNCHSLPPGTPLTCAPVSSPQRRTRADGTLPAPPRTPLQTPEPGPPASLPPDTRLCPQAPPMG